MSLSAMPVFVQIPVDPSRVDMASPIRTLCRIRRPLTSRIKQRWRDVSHGRIGIVSRKVEFCGQRHCSMAEYKSASQRRKGATMEDRLHSHSHAYWALIILLLGNTPATQCGLINWKLCGTPIGRHIPICPNPVRRSIVPQATLPT